ncbi:MULTISPECIES: ABC transporter permease [Bacillota]|uniref:ABC transporter permease n=4 Tax=Bacillota TaxID=1239 RepID=A0ABR7K7X8_9FIRM|nr:MULTISPECIES: ABC transporter permease [Erysipelotrichales]MBC6008743.1 ABC transporter permease [Catenibacterium faecis]MCR0488230.1 ABC transporter permease [[Clostridium] innocuum]MCR0593470.1 ABC transporter permease [[Clostridium] innocuum]MCR0597578.1 ABC transporter permease [[Clostridium] innocuum]
MNILSRTIKYITRKKSKSVLLLLVFLVVNVMLLSTNAMIHSLENTKDQIKQNTKSKLIVNILDDNNPIKNTVIQELEELNNINFINKRSSIIMSMDTLKAVNDTSDKNLLNIIAYDDLSKDSLFEEGKYKLSEGKIQNLHGDEVIVNHTFAEVNGLAIGDILTIKEDIVVKIVGIFMSNDEENQPKMIASKDRIENQIYISQELMNKINDNPVYTEVYAYVDNPDLIQTMQTKVSDICKEYVVTNTDTLYQQIKIPIDQVQRIASLIQIITIITSCVITTLILSMWIRARYKEMAVMISLGISKFHIYLQTFLESFILFIIGSIVASGLTFIFLDTLTTFMPMVENVSIHLKLTLNDIFMQIGIGTITITIALLVAQIPVLKTNPKEILSKMEG